MPRRSVSRDRRTEGGLSSMCSDLGWGLALAFRPDLVTSAFR